MVSMQLEIRTNRTFILRVWREKNNGAFTWRGSLTDARSGRKTYFQSIPGLMELIEKLLELTQQEKEGKPTGRKNYKTPQRNQLPKEKK